MFGKGFVSCLRSMGVEYHTLTFCHSPSQWGPVYMTTVYALTAVASNRPSPTIEDWKRMADD